MQASSRSVYWVCYRASSDQPLNPSICSGGRLFLYSPTGNKHQALGDLGRRSRRTTRDLGMAYHRPIVGQGEPFKVKSIRKERSPAGAEGIDWHRYVITQGGNTIVGHRQGSTSNVRLAVKEIVLHLNDRRVGKLSRAILSSHPFLRKKKRDLSQSTSVPRPQ